MQQTTSTRRHVSRASVGKKVACVRWARTLSTSINATQRACVVGTWGDQFNEVSVYPLTTPTRPRTHTHRRHLLDGSDEDVNKPGGNDGGIDALMRAPLGDVVATSPGASIAHVGDVTDLGVHEQLVVSTSSTGDVSMFTLGGELFDANGAAANGAAASITLHAQHNLHHNRAATSLSLQRGLNRVATCGEDGGVVITRLPGHVGSRSSQEVDESGGGGGGGGSGSGLPFLVETQILAEAAQLASLHAVRFMDEHAQTLVTAGLGGQLAVWDLRSSGTAAFEAEMAKTKAVASAGSSSSSAAAAAAASGLDSIAMAQRRKRHRPSLKWQDPRGESLLSLDIHPGRPSLVATGSERGVLSTWDIRSDRAPLLSVQTHDTVPIWSVMFAPMRPSTVLTAGQDGCVFSVDFNKDGRDPTLVGFDDSSTVKGVQLCTDVLALNSLDYDRGTHSIVIGADSEALVFVEGHGLLG